jgi:chorismate mutase/prephenate dehydrogenase
VKELDVLREKVREIDREIINLIARRIEMTKKIGEKKRDEGIPLRNWEIEKLVIESAQDVAQDLGISTNLVKSIMQKLIMESIIQQEIIHYSAYSGDKENILIIGGLGDMGGWFSYFFENQGHNVSVYDVRGTSDSFKSYNELTKEVLVEASFILIATPLDEVPLMIDTITELGFKNTVFDIASLKGHLKEPIERARARGVSITSIHPMFGPNERTLSGKVICLCDCGVEEANQRVEHLFRDTAASIIKLSLNEHDRIISYVLALSHIINVIFIKSIMQGGYTNRDLKSVASTTFLAQMVTAESVIKENPSLYYAIQRLNPFKADLYKNLKTTVESIADAVLQGNGRKFIDIMEKGREWLTQL